MRRSRAAMLVTASLAVAVCSASSQEAGSAAAKPVVADPRACRAAVVSELADVSRRIYEQAIHGVLAAASVRRIERSRTLAVAVSHRDRAAIRAALPSLVKHQVVRLEILDREDHLLYRVGRRAPAFAPLHVALRDPSGRRVGRLSLTVTDDRAYIGLVERLTSAKVVIASGSQVIAKSPGFNPPVPLRRRIVHDRGASYDVVSIAAHAYPAGRLTISSLVGRQPSSLCGTDAAQTRLRTIGYVGQRLFRTESSGRAARNALRYAANDAAFRRAVASGRPAAIRAAIIGFFGNHRYHIVRVRATPLGHPPVDVGGPYVLAPVQGLVADAAGRPAGRFSLAIQDDAGYIKLMRRFTGAAVQLRLHGATVPGSTLQPGPRRLPGFGVVRDHRRRYMAVTFTAVAFPSGPLTIGLLVPS